MRGRPLRRIAVDEAGYAHGLVKNCSVPLTILPRSSVPLAEDDQNLVPGLLALATVGIAVALHPGRHEFLLTGTGFSLGPAAVVALSGGPLLAYALSMSEQARELVGPPHHIQRLATMAAMAIAIVLAGLLAALHERAEDPRVVRRDGSDGVRPRIHGLPHLPGSRGSRVGGTGCRRWLPDHRRR
jgi:hypothetical protein